MLPTCAANYRGDGIIRILIADDTPQIRRALRQALEKHSDWEVCGEASNGLEAVSQAGELNPDVVILDLTMPNLNGFQAGSTIHSAAPKLPLLLFTQHEVGPQLKQEARNSGFKGVVNKGSFDLLIAGIESLLRGETFFTSDPSSRPDFNGAGRQTGTAERTKREDALDEAS
jgi:two-component system, NarL family, response regulator NreC